MARRRRRGHRVPWGPDRPWPPREDLPSELLDEPDDSGWPDDDPGWHPPRAGGAGVREPRRPKPTLPGVTAAADPEPDTFLDVTGPLTGATGSGV